jgi:membrane-associated phospholipid phosphatase
MARRRWLDPVLQIALFFGAYYAYRLVRGLIDGRAGAAFENARHLLDIERSLGLFFEPGLQDWTESHTWLMDASNWIYVNSHFALTTAFLIWLYVKRNDAFYFVRNTFMVSMAIALVGYVVFPTAPPRFMPEWGFTDSVTQAVGEGAAKGASLLYNPYAAVPSMHVAFALMIAVPGVLLVRSKLAKAFWVAYPLVVTFTVVATANHWWLDAVLGALTAGLSALAAKAILERARPGVWSFRGPAPKAAA